MSKRTVLIVPVFLIAFAGPGCAPPFPKELLQKVDRTVSFAELRSDPDLRRGALVMLGGMIVDIKNTKEGTLIEVLEKPLDGGGRPLMTDQTGGRFIAQHDRFLDSAVYHAGRDITIVGEVAGRKTMRLGEVDYQYPLVTVKDLHLWAPSAGPRFFFSIGVWHQI
jgi:outer membrane lipoprotein